MKARPAETITAASAAAYIILYAVGALHDPLLLASLAVVIGVIPSVVTFVVNLYRGR